MLTPSSLGVVLPKYRTNGNLSSRFRNLASKYRSPSMKTARDRYLVVLVAQDCGLKWAFQRCSTKLHSSSIASLIWSSNGHFFTLRSVTCMFPPDRSSVSHASDTSIEPSSSRGASTAATCRGRSRFASPAVLRPDRRLSRFHRGCSGAPASTRCAEGRASISFCVVGVIRYSSPISDVSRFDFSCRIPPCPTVVLLFRWPTDTMPEIILRISSTCSGLQRRTESSPR